MNVQADKGARPFPLGFIRAPLPLPGLAAYAFETKAETWGLESRVRSRPSIPIFGLFQPCGAMLNPRLLASAGSERCKSPSPGVAGEVMEERGSGQAERGYAGARRLCRPPRAPNSWVGRTARIRVPIQGLSGCVGGRRWVRGVLKQGNDCLPLISAKASVFR